MQNRQSRQTQIIILFTKRMKIVERGVQNSSAKTIIRTHLAALLPPPSPGPGTEGPPAPPTEPWAPDLGWSQWPPVARVLRSLTQFERPPLWGSMCMLKSRGANTTIGEKARANTQHSRSSNTNTAPGLAPLGWASNVQANKWDGREGTRGARVEMQVPRSPSQVKSSVSRVLHGAKQMSLSF